LENPSTNKKYFPGNHLRMREKDRLGEKLTVKDGLFGEEERV
jgi:hypothetical protein